IKPSLMGWNYNYDQDPATKDLGDHDRPGTGVYEIGRSDRKPVDSLNWFDFLASQGFTVAEWNQPPRTFAQALPSARAAFTKFVMDTQRLNPDLPPPIALIGHSRGGLLIRQVLKEMGTMGRVRWVVTLHSPHTGSELGRAP